MKTGNEKAGNRAAIIATLILAFACLLAVYYHLQVLLPLLNNGKHANAIVSDIHHGARGTRSAIYTYTTDTGDVVTARDRFLMYFKRQHRNDKLTVIYDPQDTATVTADVGIWIWQGPVIFGSGFLFFIGLGTLILRYSKDNGH